MTERQNTSAFVKATALGGVMAALAVVIMCLGGMIPFATFVCPMICMLILKVVANLCGARIGWAWYGAVAILALLLGPDKEGAALFLFLGFYPLVKPKMDKLPLPWLWKGIVFNAAILLMYFVLINLFGMAQLASEFREMGTILLLITLALGNLTFLLLDKVLGRKFRRR
jgi:hypothetical protein